MNKNTKTLAALLLVVAAMVGLSFAAVPLYSLFCQITGFGGTPQISSSLPDRVLERKVRVRFLTDVHPDLPWRFEAEHKTMTVNIGAKGLLSFMAKNVSDAPTTGTAIYNVSPAKMGAYFHKMQCFCFGEQFLAPGEDANMPVVFYIDPSIQDDPTLDDVTDVTLAYTFYRAESKALDAALEE